MLHLLTRAVLALLLVSTGAHAQQSAVDIWATLLKPKYFPDVELAEGRSIIDMKTPYRSEDAAYTPVSITAGIPQTAERYIEKLYVFVENNPQPLVGVFTLTPQMGRADLAMRVRVDQYTNVRAVAVLNTGEHHMVTNYVKAAGGCSAPLAADFEAAMERIGSMKFRTIGDEGDDDLLIGQFMLSHPNITGMQKDQKTQLIRPEHYVKTIRLYHGDDLLMTAETGFSVSADPSFRFFFRDTGARELRAEVVDSKGLAWEQHFDVPG
ncbi:MAG: quinoprotein dehydrogenase-associated SoxYZ-like carrier [Gammaproteobacteria bacterium]